MMFRPLVTAVAAMSIATLPTMTAAQSVDTTTVSGRDDDGPFSEETTDLLATGLVALGAALLVYLFAEGLLDDEDEAVSP